VATILNVCSVSALGLIRRIALHLRIIALGEQLTCFDCFVSCVRQRQFGVNPEADVDALLDQRSR
jgi:hypothetical protein